MYVHWLDMVHRSICILYHKQDSIYTCSSYIYGCINTGIYTLACVYYSYCKEVVPGYGGSISDYHKYTVTCIAFIILPVMVRMCIIHVHITTSTDI